VSNLLLAQLAACLHSVGTARLVQCMRPTTALEAAHVHDRLTAHDHVARLGAARVARMLGGAACTLGGAVTSPTQEGGHL
jgi:hypothetical protein